MASIFKMLPGMYFEGGSVLKTGWRFGTVVVSCCVVLRFWFVVL